MKYVYAENIPYTHSHKIPTPRMDIFLSKMKHPYINHLECVEYTIPPLLFHKTR
jgi:hypothetical protein